MIQKNYHHWILLSAESDQQTTLTSAKEDEQELENKLQQSDSSHLTLVTFKVFMVSFNNGNNTVYSPYIY